MDEAALKQKIIDLAAPIVNSLGLEIWGLELVGGPRATVRLFVDAPQAGQASPGQIDGDVCAGIDECEKISRQLELALDVEDCFASPWNLEVSTPGFSRRFFKPEQLGPYIGDVVEARLSEPLADYPQPASVIRGALREVAGDIFTLEPCVISADGELIPENLPLARIPFSAARRVGRVHVFKKPQKPGGRKKSAAAGKKS